MKMKKLLLSILFFLLAIAVLPQSASAHEADEGTLRHAYRPATVELTKTMRARVNNFTQVQQKRLVCVEAFQTVTNTKTHLGCLWVDLAPMNSTMADWAFEFDVPQTSMLSAGNYRVVYTYQATDGAWHHVKSINMQVTDGMYTAR